MKKYLIPAAILFASPIAAQAVCPVCIVAVGAGLGLSEYLGIDDTIAGAWIGGMLIAMSAWTINYCERKNYFKKYRSLRDPLIVIIWYLMVIWPLWSQDFFGSPINRLFGLDKLSLGIASGSIIFALAAWSYEEMKKRNHGHAHFPFEKVLIPVSSLIITSLFFYFITR